MRTVGRTVADAILDADGGSRRNINFVPIQTADVSLVVACLVQLGRVTRTLGGAGHDAAQGICGTCALDALGPGCPAR